MVNEDERRPLPPVNFIGPDNWQGYGKLKVSESNHRFALTVDD
ncbi:hypothetical protein [Citrobacter braakii]